MDMKLLQNYVNQASGNHKSLIKELKKESKSADDVKPYVRTLVTSYHILVDQLEQIIEQGRLASSRSSHSAPEFIICGAELLSIIFSIAETILWSDIFLLDEASQTARDMFEELAPVAGLLYWLAIRTGDESWLLAMEPRRQSFLSIAVPFMQMHDKHHVKPLDKLLQCSPHAALLLQPCSIHFRASLLLQMCCHGSLAKKLDFFATAWSFLNQQVSTLKASQSLRAAATVGLAGLAAYTFCCSSKSHPDHEILQRVVTLLARVANQNARALSSFIAETRPASSDLRWQDCLVEAKNQEEVQLGLVLLDADLVSAIENWPLAAVHLEHLMQMDASAKAKFHKQLQEGDSDLVKAMFAHVHASLQSFLDLVKKIEVHAEKQPKIEAIKHRVQVQWDSIREEKDCIITGGLVSNGKSSLVNAFISRLVPADWWETLVPNEASRDAFEQRNFIPTAYTENTFVVTVVEFQLATATATCGMPIEVSVWHAEEEIEDRMLDFVESGTPTQFKTLE